MWALTFELLYGPQIGVIRQEGEKKGPTGGTGGMEETPGEKEDSRLPGSQTALATEEAGKSPT